MHLKMHQIDALKYGIFNIFSRGSMLPWTSLEEDFLNLFIYTFTFLVFPLKRFLYFINSLVYNIIAI